MTSSNLCLTYTECKIHHRESPYIEHSNKKILYVKMILILGEMLFLKTSFPPYYGAWEYKPGICSEIQRITLNS